MILNTMHLNQRLSVDDQKKEFERIKNAPVGTILFTIASCANSDIVDTLLHRSGVQYHVGVAGYTSKYYKD